MDFSRLAFFSVKSARRLIPLVGITDRFASQIAFSVLFSFIFINLSLDPHDVLPHVEYGTLPSLVAYAVNPNYFDSSFVLSD